MPCALAYLGRCETVPANAAWDGYRQGAGLWLGLASVSGSLAFSLSLKRRAAVATLWRGPCERRNKPQNRPRCRLPPSPRLRRDKLGGVGFHPTGAAYPIKAGSTRRLASQRGTAAWNQPIGLRRNQDLRTERENIDQKPPSRLPYVKQISRG
jgi:hypothetical protein